MSEVNPTALLALFVGFISAMLGFDQIALEWRLALGLAMSIVTLSIFIGFGHEIDRRVISMTRYYRKCNPVLRLLVTFFAALLTAWLLTYVLRLAQPALLATVPSIASESAPALDPAEAQINWYDSNGIGIALVEYDPNGPLKAKVALRNDGDAPISAGASKYGSPLYLLIRSNDGFDEASLNDYERIVEYQGELVLAVRSQPDGWSIGDVAGDRTVDWPVNSVSPGQSYYDLERRKGNLVFVSNTPTTRTYLGIAYIPPESNVVAAFAPIESSSFRWAAEF